MKILIRNRQRRRPINNSKIEKAAEKILALLKQPRLSGAELSILFVGDRRMRQLNSDFRGIPRSTDVLSFETAIPVQGETPNPVVLGDIVICIPKAEEQARSAGISFYEEVFRLMIHGVLHLVGYEHEVSEYGARAMRRKEKMILNAIKTMV
jgi:probable rRNA maturation factor